MLGKLRECFIVITRLVPRNQFGPPDNSLLAFAEKRTFKVIIGTENVELFFRPACCSPDQAIVPNSVLAFVKCRNLDHGQGAGLGVELATQAILLQNRLQRQ